MKLSGKFHTRQLNNPLKWLSIRKIAADMSLFWSWPIFLAPVKNVENIFHKPHLYWRFLVESYIFKSEKSEANRPFCSSQQLGKVGWTLVSVTLGNTLFQSGQKESTCCSHSQCSATLNGTQRKSTLRLVPLSACNLVSILHQWKCPISFVGFSLSQGHSWDLSAWSKLVQHLNIFGMHIRPVLILAKQSTRYSLFLSIQ